MKYSFIYKLTGTCEKFSVSIVEAKSLLYKDLDFYYFKESNGYILFQNDGKNIYSISYFDSLGSLKGFLGERSLPSQRGDCNGGSLAKDWEAFYSSQTVSISLFIQGTFFQHQVWQSLLEIPYGVTNTYQDVATSIDKPKSARPVGTAVGKNKFYRIIPCHRVIPQNRRDIGGYAWGVGQKQYLLKKESNEGESQ